MPDFAALIADFQGPDKEMAGYKEPPSIDAASKKDVSRLQKEIFQVECHTDASQI